MAYLFDVKENNMEEKTFLENLRKKTTQLDKITKFFLILLAAAGVYLLAFFLLTPFFTPAYSSSMAMMMQQMGFSSPSSPYLWIVSLLMALIAAIPLSFYLFHQVSPAFGKVSYETDSLERYRLLRQGLGVEEKILLDHIKEAGEITQDSLRFRLEWSKAKVSTLLTTLEKKGMVQRERTGKTYRVFLQKATVQNGLTSNL